MRVFFSHSSRDKPLLREVRQQLPAFLDTWIDEDQLLIGVNFGKRLEDTIAEESDFVVIFINDDAASSEWLKKELAWALARERELGVNFVLPVLLSSNEGIVAELGLEGRLFLRSASYASDDIKSLARKLSEHLFGWTVKRLDALSASRKTAPRASPMPAGDWTYDIPNVLVVFQHNEPEEDGAYMMSALKVITIRALRDADLEIRSVRRSIGTIVSSEVISNPVDTVSVGDGTPHGGTREIIYDAKTGDQYVQATESKRKIIIGQQNEAPENDPILDTLYTRFLLSPQHAYNGTRAIAPTERMRLLLYFNGPVCPRHVHAVLIDESGGISTRRTRLEFVPERSLYVIEADNVAPGTGLYAYWRWPNAAQPPGQ